MIWKLLHHFGFHHWSKWETTNVFNLRNYVEHSRHCLICNLKILNLGGSKMTQPELSDNEMRMVIAMHKGWRWYKWKPRDRNDYAEDRYLFTDQKPCKDWFPLVRPTRDNIERYFEDPTNDLPPDWVEDMYHAWELADEIATAGWVVILANEPEYAPEGMYYFVAQRGDIDLSAKHFLASFAICKVYIEWSAFNSKH